MCYDEGESEKRNGFFRSQKQCHNYYNRMFILFFSFLVSGVFQSRKSSYSKSNNANDIIELKKCGAYEVIQLAMQRVIMKENPVYGEVGTSHDS